MKRIPTCPYSHIAAGCAAGLLGLLACGSAFAAGDAAARPSWPAFHGADRLNASSEKGLMKRWPDGGPRLLWKYEACGRGYSGVSIADGTLFTAGDFPEAEMVIALDLNGRLLWKAPNGKPWKRSSPGSRATPTHDAGRLYQMSPLGRLGCFEARTGKPVWALDLKEEFDARWGIWALAENVLIDRVWVHDVSDHGIYADSAVGRTSIRLRDSLVEQTGGVGVFVASTNTEIGRP